MAASARVCRVSARDPPPATRARVAGGGGADVGAYWYWMYDSRGTSVSSSAGVSSASPFFVSLP